MFAFPLHTSITSEGCRHTARVARRGNVHKGNRCAVPRRSECTAFYILELRVHKCPSCMARMGGMQCHSCHAARALQIIAAEEITLITCTWSARLRKCALDKPSATGRPRAAGKGEIMSRACTSTKLCARMAQLFARCNRDHAARIEARKVAGPSCSPNGRHAA